MKPTGKPHPVPHKTEVYTLRDWKEYLGESLLIIFSVLLALFLTEWINKVHEKNDTRDMLENIKAELVKNKAAETEQYQYEEKVLKNIDDALKNPSLQQKIINNDEFHLGLIAPQGVTYRDLSSVAWDVAKGHDILGKVDFKVISQLTDLYIYQARVAKLEDEVAKILLSPDSRKLANAHVTLILIRDNYKAWAFDRAPFLLKKYDEAIKTLDEYNK